MEKTSRPVDLVLKNAKIFIDQQVFEGGIAVDQGKIVKICKNSKLPPGDEIVNIAGQLVIPGVIDIHTHLRDLKYSRKEDFFTGTCAAANGGITTVIDMPNTNPPTISSQLLKEKMIIAQRKIVINTGFYAGIPNKLKEINSFKDLGIFGFKLFLSHSLSQFNIENTELLQKLFRKLKEINYPILIHAERKKDIEELIDQNKKKGLTSQELYLKSHSREVERRAIEYIIKLDALINTQIHICHVSTTEGVEIIEKMKNERRNISAEVTPHHLFLTKDDLESYGTFAKILPPLRTFKDLAALWRGINKGTIDIISTDHAPHMLSEKECDFSQAANGIPGFETYIPLLFTAIHKEKVHLSRLIQIISENPANFLQLSNKGKILVGFDADLTVIDLKKEKMIKAADFFSKAKFSPFNKYKVKGIPTMTIVNGKIIMDDGDIQVPMGLGNIIRRPS
ncbi:MAG: dihydroorotase family protein [Promethearchaeota archaeon]